jgi:glycosyltransferase involved in cell wall biosynthesis
MSKRPQKKKIAFITSFLPRKCGIATFTSDLITNTIDTEDSLFEPLVVTLRSDSKDKYENPVKFEIRQNVREDYLCAADYLNFSHVDIVSLQHEFGLFGGDAGSHLSHLLKRLKAPIVTTLHTVLNDPSPAYKKTMLDVCDYSKRVVTMNERGLDMLRDIYGIPAEKVQLIAHGIPDSPFVDSNYYKHKFGLEGRRTILTFGLLSKNKGIESMLKILPAVIKADPSVMYIILGMTHPNVLKQDGEAYRFSLQHIVKDLGLDKHVIFYNRFVNDDELLNFLCATDVYVTPYLNEEQLTSGTLSFAVGTGKAVVSTPYWAACELLADERGLLVPFGDSDKMAESIIKILMDDEAFYALRRRAYDYGRTRIWPEIGKLYHELFSHIATLPAQSACKPLSTSETLALTSTELPIPSLDHITRMTDDTGLYQHAQYTIPNRDHGYCTDDNARAVILMTNYYSKYVDPHAQRLLDTYLSFILHSRDSKGMVRNFMHFDRTWMHSEPVNDAFGRVLWALGAVIANPPTPAYISIAKECFDGCIDHVQRQFPRGMAYAIIGMCDYLIQFPGASEIKRHIEMAADGLMAQYKENGDPEWQWFEDSLTYDNGILPHALFAAGTVLSQQTYIDVATTTCAFLLDAIMRKDHFSFIGCKGWYEREKERAAFDQQPIDAASTIHMLKAAYLATGKRLYLTLQRKAFDWFLGANDIHVPLYDSRTQGCCDGLMPDGTNANQGAESTLAFLLSLLDVRDSVTLLENNHSEDHDAGNSKNPGPQDSSHPFQTIHSGLGPCTE